MLVCPLFDLRQDFCNEIESLGLIDNLMEPTKTIVKCTHYIYV